MAERICFRLHVRRDKREEYVRRHAEVWPDMRERYNKPVGRTTRCSWPMTAPSSATSTSNAKTSPQPKLPWRPPRSIARWQQEMAEFFGERPDEGIRPEPEIFHLN